MATYAEMSGDTITNIVEADADFAAANGLTAIDGLDPMPGIGWTLAGGAWSPPAPSATATAIQSAQGVVNNLYAQMAAQLAQIQSDAALFANVADGSTLSAAQGAAVQRAINGFANVITALKNHMVLTGVLPPEAAG
ncbi:MAG TPA: hypothetical protein VFN61_01965 [Acidimicrobiales bacterium]|nr:hypothetical protein [Acidimicrobiales bacterium]